MNPLMIYNDATGSIRQFLLQNKIRLDGHALRDRGGLSVLECSGFIVRQGSRREGFCQGCASCSAFIGAKRRALTRFFLPRLYAANEAGALEGEEIRKISYLFLPEARTPSNLWQETALALRRALKRVIVKCESPSASTCLSVEDA